jgi:hypothetical protein
MRESFILYHSFYQAVKDLTDEEKGQLWDAVYQYQLKMPIRELSPVCKMAFKFMESQFERDSEKYERIIERNKRNGAKGGRPEKNPDEPKKPSGLNGNPENPDEPKKADTDTDTVTDIKEKDKKKNVRFSPPTLQEVKNFFSENGYSPDAGQRAFEYYTEANWKDSTGKQVKNWKQKMRGVWFKKENEQKKQVTGYTEKIYQEI